MIRQQVIGAAMALLLSTAALAAGAVETKWDITNTAQPYRDVEFAVTEGTWLGVDVSPDGNTLMFDLLGDIYSLPAAGGDATLVHGGPAMQTAMSFSPDGGQLLYLSDASGVANAWVSNLDGSSPRQVTHEKTDILTSPTWAPDGRSFAVTRTSNLQPEMYSSEIRWFDIAGGGGRVLVDMPKNRRDVQEARFSGDGRFLYYTERLTNPFVYVDANHINYAIKRRDLSNGATESLLQDFGGATTPQISPDGRHVAFIRRVKTRTVLFVYDVETGQQRPVFDGLDRDAQAETWLQTGYFPRFDWFPDNRIVAVGAADAVKIPGEAQVIDVTGQTLMPGLIDMHGHIECCFAGGLLPQKQPGRYATLAFGVTTNFDPYTSEINTYESAETARAGLTVSPRWIGSGHVIYGRSKIPGAKYVPIASYHDAYAVMERKRALGGMIIKSYKQPSRSQRQQLVKAGRDSQVMVDVEGDGYYNVISMYLDGHTNVEHSIAAANYYDDVVQLMGRAGVSNTPTLVVLFGELYGENYMYQTTRAWEDPKIVMDGNPLEDIAAANSVRYTMINGRLYDSLSMNEIGNRPRQRSRFYWELADYKGIDWNEAWAEQ